VIRLSLGQITFWPEYGSKSMAEMTESSPGLEAHVTFFKADGVTPAKIDGKPRWGLTSSPAGNAVGILKVDDADPFHATITPAPMGDDVEGSAHSCDLKVEGDGDLDAGEERLVVATTVITVVRDEAQTAGIVLTPSGAATGTPPTIDNSLPSLPGDGSRPDNSLPSGGAGIDNTLPGSGWKPGDPRPDNTLPGSGARPDNSLPGSQPGVDNTLPGSGARPDNTLPDAPSPKDRR
jgi:hypothetical protein